MRSIAIAGAVAIATLLPASPASANQPYGGCKEAWQAPHSSGAKACRSHGWTVTRKIVVTPRKQVVFDRLPECRYEDGSSQRSACTWNLHPDQPQGNGVGLGYWLDRKDRTHYVWTTPMCVAAVYGGGPAVRQCRKAGWWIERDRVPLSTETSPWTYMDAYLAVSPSGHVYVDTLGQMAGR